MIESIMSGSLIRDTPPCARMSAGTRSNAITATAPASSAIFACSAVTTSMITPPLSISAMPRLTRAVPVAGPVSAPVPGLVDDSGVDGAGVDTEDLTGDDDRQLDLHGRPGEGPARAGGSAGGDRAVPPDQRDPDLTGRERRRLAVDRVRRHVRRLAPGPPALEHLAVAEDQRPALADRERLRRVRPVDVVVRRGLHPHELHDERRGAELATLGRAVLGAVHRQQPPLLRLG